MSYLSKILWIVPFAVHIGFAVSVVDQFPENVGRTPSSDGVPLMYFYCFFFASVIIANGLFSYLYVKMPTFKDRMFSVPQRAFWLSDDQHRKQLVSKLRGIIEVSLLGLNVFFLAVFQSIYQANVVYRTIALNPVVLLVGFMLAPLLLVVVYFVLSVISLSRGGNEKA